MLYSWVASFSLACLVTDSQGAVGSVQGWHYIWAKDNCHLISCFKKINIGYELHQKDVQLFKAERGRDLVSLLSQLSMGS